jgi:DNA repair exonuclease SbcCD ATPase subunit
MTVIAIRTTDVIAAEIRSIDTQTREIVLRSVIEIGNRLNEAKELVAHGEWGSWLETNVNYSQSTANNFMRVAEEYGSNYQAFGNLNFTQAVALLAVQGEDREQFATGIGADELSTRELKEAIKEKKRLEKQLKQLEVDLQKSEEHAKTEREASSALQDRVSKLTIELAEAKIAGKDDEAEKLRQSLEASKSELADSLAKIKKLETELKKKPIDVPATVEVIPPAIEAELAELRKKATGAAAIKFRVQFEALSSGFSSLLTTLEEIKVGEPETFDKFKAAVSVLIGKMAERL